MTDQQLPDDQFGFRDPWGSDRRLAGLLRAQGIAEDEIVRLVTFRAHAGQNIRIHQILGTIDTEVAKGGPVD